jgi:dipeptidyl aminopeptidase/acylaminoacyl peptidase
MGSVRSASLSPDGSKMVFLSRQGGSDYVSIFDFATGETTPVVSATDIRARAVYFAGPDHVVLIASDAERIEYFLGKNERSSALVYNLATKKLVRLLANTDGIYPGQTSFGNVLAIDPDGRNAYLGVFLGDVSQEPRFSVVKVDMDTGKWVRGSSLIGERDTIDWLITRTGKAVARTDYNPVTHDLTIHVYDDGRSREIFREKQDRPSIGVMAETPESDLVVGNDDGSEFGALSVMSRVDGSMKPMTTRPGAGVAGIITDPDSRSVLGIIYAGMTPTYEFYDKGLSDDLAALAQALPDTSIAFASRTRDWTKILLLIDGGNRPPRYMLFDRTKKKLSLVAATRPDIAPADIGEQQVIRYKARDGLEITAVLTWPTGIAKDARKNLPMVVMPHGGPASYDRLGFDWLAQFIANEGFVVLQPNFRGSAGFGATFEEAGHREWGRKAQDDVTDGVLALQKMGWADASRTCIVGWSYGGYSALIGGAVTPDLYKCVVSIAGVSDLRDMLFNERKIWGSKSGSYTYWKDVIGDPDTDGAAIDAVSPARLADKFKAPVLLVHGSDDSTVPASQSDKMESALRSAGKDVKYIRIRGDDHGLVDPESRATMLKALGDFLQKHIGG